MFLERIFEMSELCNNSACFYVEIGDASDICVTFVFYNKANKKIKLAARRQKKKSRRTAGILYAHFETAAFEKIKAAVSFIL